MINAATVQRHQAIPALLLKEISLFGWHGQIASDKVVVDGDLLSNTFEAIQMPFHHAGKMFLNYLQYPFGSFWDEVSSMFTTI